MKRKLTDANVEFIMRSRHSDHPLTLSKLAKRFKVAVPTISHVVYGITHKDVTGLGRRSRSASRPVAKRAAAK